MEKSKRKTVIKSASVPVELAELMEINNISPSEAMRYGILKLLENREFVIVSDELKKLLDEKEVIAVDSQDDAKEVIEKVPLYQLPEELKAKRLAKNIYNRVRDTLLVEKMKVLEIAASNGISASVLEEEVKKMGVQVI